jgi:uncharacterized protein (DUF433 family)
MVHMRPATLLEREMFSEAEAARLLRVAPSTLNYWLEGGRKRGKTYRPVIRAQARGGHPPVTWAEFVEAGLLKQYRRDLNVPMTELRAFIERLRERLGVPYPLADQRPFVSNRELVREIQDEVGLSAEFCLVAEVRGQLALLPASEDFYQRVTWDESLAAGWRPHDDPESTVRMFPGSRGGRPAVSGISTVVVWEHADAGEAVDEITDQFGLSVADVQWALSYEAALHAA